jgi:hypothetical protein
VDARINTQHHQIQALAASFFSSTTDSSKAASLHLHSTKPCPKSTSVSIPRTSPATARIEESPAGIGEDWMKKGWVAARAGA